MNTKVQTFWNDFCTTLQKDGIQYKDAFQFGVSADWLANLVVEGKKTATTSGFVFYELEKEAIPKVGEYYIVLNGQEDPVAVIQVQDVEVVPMNKVTEEFALAEGEGDYRYWWDAHEEFFTELLKELNLEFSPDMLVVCERFRKVYSR
ncbi:ASCH domain-containing protein [Alkalihalobacillus sp. MEB130]|uniref:ASCH domain-containing protein n=1 Tax=Alkalihalobacillus sp. MEB130 TaxID=2976704 RepID=UPI0028DE35EF|nr:ASCH domain-containing protein [Alkalihalobacillus sp. MEB130]MDT8862579.1 ASCH domain-containing protein [Alkalihalobacillus sp. MEB130]